MAAAIFILSVFSILLTCGIEGAKLPKKPASAYFKICHRSDPEVNNCIKNTILDLKPMLLQGIPELEVVALDPLFIPKFEFSEGTGNLQLKQTSTNLTIHGLKDFDVSDVKTNFDNFELTLDMKTPNILFKGNYEMDGKILVIPIKGNGDYFLNFTDVTTICRAEGEKISRNGKEYMLIKKLHLEVDTPKHANVQFNNLFNGDKFLGETTNKFLNENWKEAFRALKRIAEEALGEIFKDIFNTVFKKFPYEELFPQ